ncbi:MAG: hypothetical protein WBC65_16800 [Ignavibacteria bacterium]
MVSCEKESDEIIDPSFASPAISNLVLSNDSVITTSSSPMINLIVSVNVNLNDGSPINKVQCRVYDPVNTQIGVYQLNDNGSSPDPTAGDRTYTGAINIENIQCLLVGNYSLEVVAENTSGLFSNLITSSFIVVNSANQPPRITTTNLPDSIVRPMPGDSSLLTITVNVNDPDGICDVKDVSFVTVRPNGVTLPAIPMFNSGSGVFSFSNYVSFSSDPTSYGYFKYTFTARDNSNLLSASVKDSILFISPR